jgi:hypothetical protein
MDDRDYIGKRGETIFAFLITKMCDGRFWLDYTFLGGKAESLMGRMYGNRGAPPQGGRPPALFSGDPA